jgi:hypothetical protein
LQEMLMILQQWIHTIFLVNWFMSFYYEGCLKYNDHQLDPNQILSLQFAHSFAWSWDLTSKLDMIAPSLDSTILVSICHELETLHEQAKCEAGTRNRLFQQQTFGKESVELSCSCVPRNESFWCVGHPSLPTSVEWELSPTTEEKSERTIWHLIFWWHFSILR